VLHDPRHSGSHLDFASLLAAHVMKMMAVASENSVQ
jgi:hypothetical protein